LVEVAADLSAEVDVEAKAEPRRELGVAMPETGVKLGCVNTARVMQRGLSKLTVMTRNGRASVSATGSSGIPRSKESGRERTKAKVPEMRMVEAGWAKRPVSVFETGSGFQGR
jgi:hypothetical protein